MLVWIIILTIIEIPANNSLRPLCSSLSRCNKEKGLNGVTRSLSARTESNYSRPGLLVTWVKLAEDEDYDQQNQFAPELNLSCVPVLFLLHSPAAISQPTSLSFSATVSRLDWVLTKFSRHK